MSGPYYSDIPRYSLSLSSVSFFKTYFMCHSHWETTADPIFQAGLSFIQPSAFIVILPVRALLSHCLLSVGLLFCLRKQCPLAGGGRACSYPCPRTRLSQTSYSVTNSLIFLLCPHIKHAFLNILWPNPWPRSAPSLQEHHGLAKLKGPPLTKPARPSCPWPFPYAISSGWNFLFHHPIYQNLVLLLTYTSNATSSLMFILVDHYL